jgi:hypothetical protein
MERLPNRYPKISQSHKVPLYKGLSLFYPKLLKYVCKTKINDLLSLASYCDYYLKLLSLQKIGNIWQFKNIFYCAY